MLNLYIGIVRRCLEGGNWRIFTLLPGVTLSLAMTCASNNVPRDGAPQITAQLRQLAPWCPVRQKQPLDCLTVYPYGTGIQKSWSSIVARCANAKGGLARGNAIILVRHDALEIALAVVCCQAPVHRPPTRVPRGR